MAEETNLGECTLVLSIVKPDGEVVSKIETPYADVVNVRRRSGAPPSAILENMLESASNLAQLKANPQQNLGPRKPGGQDFNK